MTRPRTGGRPSIVWTPEMDAIVVGLRSGGASWAVAAYFVGVSITACKARSAVLREWGLITAPDRTHAPPTRRTVEQLDRLKAMVRDGVTIWRAAKVLGVGYHTAKYWARVIGLTEART